MTFVAGQKHQKAGWYRLKMSISPFNNWGVMDSEPGWFIGPRTQQLCNAIPDFGYLWSAITTIIKQLTSALLYLHRCLKCNNMHPNIVSVHNQHLTKIPVRLSAHFGQAPNQKIEFIPPFQPSAPRQLKHRPRAMGPWRVSNTGQFYQQSFEYVPW